MKIDDLGKIGDFKLKVKKSKSGKGLFTEEDIPKGKYIIEYFGRVLDPGEEYTINSQYLFEITKKITIQGNIKENIARYINHSCRPNCEVIIKKGRLLIYSKKNIKSGEELNYDYGKEFFNEYVKPKGCKCEKCEKVRK